MPMTETQQALQAQMEAGFEAMRERFDDQRELSTQRHAENVQRLTTIEAEVKKTNGRVTRTEEQIRTLFRDWRAKASEKVTAVTPSGVTRRDVQMCIYGGTGVIVAWKFAEFVFHLLSSQVRP